MNRMVSIFASGMFVVLLGSLGCQNPPLRPIEPANDLTVGTVQSEISVGMDAASVAQILGSPNIVTTDEKRREVWIYDKISTDTVDMSDSIGGTIIIFSQYSSQRQRTTTQRTLTIIIKFDEENRVRDFAYNSSKF